jgi:hypothetical protein
MMKTMIRFPQQHIADSVTERILRFAQQQEMTRANNVQAQGARIESALQEPAGDMATIDGMEDNLVMRAFNL